MEFQIAVTKARSLRQEACDWINEHLLPDETEPKRYRGLFHNDENENPIYTIDKNYINNMRKQEQRGTDVEAYALCCKYKMRIDMYMFDTDQTPNPIMMVPEISDKGVSDYSEIKYFCSLFNQRNVHFKIYTKDGKRQVDDGFFLSEGAGAVVNTNGAYVAYVTTYAEP